MRVDGGKFWDHLRIFLKNKYFNDKINMALFPNSSIRNSLTFTSFYILGNVFLGLPEKLEDYVIFLSLNFYNYQGPMP
jgi:hypothetical protein